MGIDTGDINEDYYFERFSLQHFSSMHELFRSAFGVELTKGQFLQRYDTAALGHEVIAYLAFHKQTQTPAAYYGVFPLQLTYQDKSFSGAQSGDTMTHAGHRKKGLFVWLAKKTFETCRQAGIQLIFGMPNENSYPGFINRLDWKQVDSIIRHDLKLNFKTFPLPKIMRRLGLFGLYLRTANVLFNTSDLDKFDNPLPATHVAKVIRNRAYLDYKKDSGTYFITIGQVVFWIKLTDVFWIGEASDYDLIDDDVIKKLKRLAFFLGYNTISFHLNQSITPPSFLKNFKKYNDEPLCFYYFDNEFQNVNLLLTGADFDTW